MSDYIKHSVWSEPGRFREQLLALPEELTLLADALENFVIHHVAARSLGFGVPEYAETDRNSRSMQRLLATAFARDKRSLTEKRGLADYLYGTCHDFSLLSASALRSRGIPCRLRVGFVDYLARDFWEDHWLCEYWQGGKWSLFDPQMGRRAREGFGIDFSVDELPRYHFKSAAELWQDLRQGKVDQKKCGVSFIKDIPGEWVCAANLLRDTAALCKIEMLPWDFWGISREFVANRAISEGHYLALDELATVVIKFELMALSGTSTLKNEAGWALPVGKILSFFQEKSIEVEFAQLLEGLNEA